MQMTMPSYGTRFDSLSLSACYLELRGVGDPKHATGFFWRNQNKVFLVTNWHVVTGINPLNGTSKGWCPELVQIDYFPKPKRDGDGPVTTTVPTFELKLYEDFNSPMWIQHSMTSEWGVDLVLIEIGESLVDRATLSCVNDREYPQLYHFAGSEIFVLGHPRTKSQSKYPIAFPIWKRGSIASELIVPFDGRPAFLIDSRTSNGMSGSPVFSRVFGPAAYADNTIRTDNILASEFMGIYSGRLHDDENNASLGLVWHRNLIDQILESPESGSRIWCPSTTF